MTVKYEEIKRALKGLSLEDLEQLQEDIARETEKYVGLADFFNGCAEQRFAEGLVCPHFGKKNIVKFGRARGKQIYRCKDCGKTFNTLTKTVFADSKLPISKLLRYAECMSEQMTLRESAKAVGACLKTSFYMRRTLLSAIKEHIGIDHLAVSLKWTGSSSLRVSRATIRRTIPTGKHQKTAVNQEKEARKCIIVASVVNRSVCPLLWTGTVVLSLFPSATAD